MFPSQPPASPLASTPEQPAIQPSKGKDAGFWRQQIAAAVRKRQRYEPWWEANLKAYAPFVDSTIGPDGYGHDVRTNRTFTLVERKKADLFYRRPDVTLQPTPVDDEPIPGVPGPPNPQTGQPTGIPASAALQTHQDILNEHLGEDGIDASALMDRVTFDLVCTQGESWSKMGYESYTRDVMQEVTVGQQPMPGAVLGLGASVPITQQVPVPVPVVEKCFWEHFSGKQGLKPADFRSTQWDKAPWLGMAFELPLTEGNRRKFKLPADFAGTRTDQKQHYDLGDASEPGQNIFVGQEIWYRSMLYRDDIAHPDHLTQLVLVDGVDQPVIHRDSPYQTLLPDGTLSPDSLLGFPIHPFSTRVLTDSSFVASDGTMIRPLENELDIFRTQLVQFRDASILRYKANSDVLPPDALNKIVRSPIGGIISMPGDAFASDAIQPLESGHVPRESFSANDYIDNDLARTTGIDAQGAGVQSDRSSTATEQQLIASNANARLDKERSVLLQRYIKGVTKYSTLIQRFTPVKDAAAIVGTQRATIWDAWRKTASSVLAFTAMPDSALRTDAAIDRSQARELYSFLANDPFVQKGRGKLLEQLLRRHHVDPTGIVQAPDPPKPPAPNLSFAFKGEDLVGPQAPIVLEIMQQGGITISPTAVQQSQGLLLTQQQMQAAAEAEKAAKKEGDTRHGGMLPAVEPLSKHAADRTGAMQGIGGQPTPFGAGGSVQ